MRVLLVSLLVFVFSLPVVPVLAVEEEVEEIIVIGSRIKTKNIENLTIPVDIIPARDIQRQVGLDMNSLLSQLAPSYNVKVDMISDGASVVRPPSLRGLPPDNILVAINGKRRHRASVIAFLGGGISDGAHGPDMATIPSIALKRVEILRDGAAAQYGADAIAGIINFVLRDNLGSEVVFTTGQYSQGDGAAYSISGNMGVPLGKGGVLNMSLEISENDSTSRSVQRDDALALIAAGNEDVRQPYAQIWGEGEVKDNFKFFANFNYDIEGHELYGFGNVSSRTSTGPFYFRNPHTRGGVFTKDGGKNVLVADLSSDGTSGGCPAVPIVNNVPDATALAQVASNPNCFAFIQRFPGGFTPNFSGEVEEYSFALGLKGLFNFPFLGEWEYDLSAVWGTHQTDFFIFNTVNPQLVARQLDVPTRYNPGAYSETDLTINADFLRLVEMPFFRNPVNLSWGVEYRQEEFDIIAGGENSWFVDPNIAKQGFAVGSNGFPGFNLRDAGASKRGAWSVYIDSEVKLSDKTEMGLALRHEKYEDFDDALDGKLAFRYEVNENVLLRASFNSGVRIPTVGQANVRNVTTEFVLGKLLDQATLPSTHPISVQKGGKPLKAERSENLSFGIVVRQGRARFSMDYYDFNVQDRIALTSPLALTDADKAQLLAEGFADSSSFSQVRYFTNDFDTRTKGIDITYKTPLGRGNKTNFSLTANWIETKVTKRNKAIVDDVRAQRLEALHPKLRYSAAITHEGNEWGALVRMRYYGPASEDYLEDINLTVESSNHYLFDVEMTRKIPSLGNISLGVRNLLNKRPDRNPYSGIAGSLYPEYGPFGNGGAFYYIRIQRKMF